MVSFICKPAANKAGIPGCPGKLRIMPIALLVK